MNRKRLLPLLALLAAALLLAFPLQDFLRTGIIEPLLYFFWGMGILYKSVPQFWIWVLLLGIVFFILLTPFLEDLPRLRGRERKIPPKPGAIEELAETLKQLDKGIYFKWVVANRLGKIIRNWVAYRDRLDKRWQANDLERLGWDASPEIRQYLDAGLNGSFADYPRFRIPFIRIKRKTPLDLDPNLVLDFLSKEMENECCE